MSQTEANYQNAFKSILQEGPVDSLKPRPVGGQLHSHP